MWEKAAFLAYFAGMALAQRAVMANLQVRQAANSPSAINPIVSAAGLAGAALPNSPQISSAPQQQTNNGDASSDPALVFISGLPPYAVLPLSSFVQTLDPAATQTLIIVPPSGTNAAAVVPLNGFKPLQPKDPQQFTPGVADLPPNVFTSVFFPSVPTAQPTGVEVPTVITYTGTLSPTDIPAGYQLPSGSFIVPVPTSIPSISNFPSISMPTSMTSRATSSSTKSSSALSTTTSSKSSTSSTSSTSSMSSTSSRTSSSTSSTSSASTSAPQKSNDSTHDTSALSGRAIAGIVVGLVSGLILVAALAAAILFRRRQNKVPDSPGIYPQEAYLYDPPMTPPPASRAGLANGHMGMQRSATPELPGGENDGLLLGPAAGGIGAAGAGAAASENRNGPGPITRPPAGWNGYSPVDDMDAAEAGNSRNPFTDPPPPVLRGNPFADQGEDYRRVPGRGGGNDRWPLNPNADSGLGTPPGTSSGVAGPSDAGEGPSVQGVGSQRYDRHLSPQMREVRRAWGWDN